MNNNKHWIAIVTLFVALLGNIAYVSYSYGAISERVHRNTEVLNGSVIEIKSITKDTNDKVDRNCERLARIEAILENQGD